jgi:DNA polymerase elongation subunit (family B)
MTLSFRILPKVFGRRLPHCGSWASILSVRVGRESFPSPRQILLFRLQTWWRDTVNSNVMWLLGPADRWSLTGEDKPFIRNVFNLNTCANIVGSQVLTFKKEGALLDAWRDFIEEVDADVLIGYNIANFDFPYLLDRAKALDVSRFNYLGRLKSMHLTWAARYVILMLFS